MGVLGPLRGPWEGDFYPILTGNLLKTTKIILKPIHLQDNSIKTYNKHIFTLEIPINTLVPRRIRVVIGSPSDNPLFWTPVLKIGPRPQNGVKNTHFLGYFWGIFGAKMGPQGANF